MCEFLSYDSEPSHSLQINQCGKVPKTTQDAQLKAVSSTISSAKGETSEGDQTLFMIHIYNAAKFLYLKLHFPNICSIKRHYYPKHMSCMSFIVAQKVIDYTAAI